MAHAEISEYEYASRCDRESFSPRSWIDPKLERRLIDSETDRLVTLLRSFII